MYKVNPCLDEVILDKNNVCHICNTVVQDVTHKTEEEVQQMYLQNNNKLCIKTSKSRLNTPYYLHPFKRFAFAVILVFGCSLFTLSTFAQDSIVKIQNHINKNDSVAYNDSQIIISGVIKDVLGDPLPFVNVLYHDTTNTVYGCVTDLNGKYRLAIKNKSLYVDSLSIKVSYVGYKTKIVKVSTQQLKKTNLIVDINYTKNEEMFIRGTFGLYVTPQIDSAPDTHRSTTFKREEINKHPRP